MSSSRSVRSGALTKGEWMLRPPTAPAVSTTASLCLWVEKNWGSPTTRSFLGRLDAGVVVFGNSLLGVGWCICIIPISEFRVWDFPRCFIISVSSPQGHCGGLEACFWGQKRTMRKPTCIYIHTHAHTPERKDLIQTSETLKIFQCLFQTHSQVRLSCELSLALSLLILFGRLVLKSAARLAKFRFIMHRV